MDTDSKSLRCIVIDDDDLSIETMIEYIEKVPGLIIDQVYQDPLKALNEISAAEKVDFIFLDIEMPNLSGLELAKELRDRTHFLVFATGHNGHALKAFELHIDQYLLKPFSFAEFALRVAELLKKKDRAFKQTALTENQHYGKLFIKTDQKHSYRQIDPQDIIYIEGAKNYVVIHTEDEDFMPYMGLNHMESALDPNKFIRISKSTIIPVDRITKVDGHAIKLGESDIVQLGEKYKDKFFEFLKQHLVNDSKG